MKIIKTPAALIMVLAIISCSFSTSGTLATKKSTYQEQPSTKPVAIKPIDTSKYTVAKKLTPLEQAKRDSALKNYIGGIVKPYVEDLKESNNKTMSSLIDIIRAQNIRSDSLSNIRNNETKLNELNSASRDSVTQALIRSNKSNDSLKTLIMNLDRKSTDIINSLGKVFGNIQVFANIMFIIMAIIGFVILLLNLGIFLSRRQTKKYHA